MTEKQAVARIALYCSKAERSEYDVRKKLTAWEIDKEIADRIVLFLRKENFLDEERFCRSFIKDKIRFNKWGKNKIVFELRKKQVSEKQIQKCFEGLDEEYDFEAPLIKLLSSKITTVKAKNDYEKRAKLYRFAMGRGFAPEAIQKCLSQLLGNNYSDEDII